MTRFDDNPIFLVDDDIDDLELATIAIRDLGYLNEIVSFTSGQDLVYSLSNSNIVPFVIICDVNLPKSSGLEVRRELTKDRSLKYQSIPFIFWSTAATSNQIQDAFDSWSQGIFEKPSSIADLKTLISAILTYWKLCGHPKSTPGR